MNISPYVLLALTSLFWSLNFIIGKIVSSLTEGPWLSGKSHAYVDDAGGLLIFAGVLLVTNYGPSDKPGKAAGSSL